MKNVKFRGKKTNSAVNSAAQIPRQKPKFRGIPRATVGPTNYTPVAPTLFKKLWEQNTFEMSIKFKDVGTTKYTISIFQ